MVYRLPPCADELNAVEPVWSHLKRSLANLTEHTIAELTALAKTRLKRMQYCPGLLTGFLASTGLDLGPFLLTPAVDDLQLGPRHGRCHAKCARPPGAAAVDHVWVVLGHCCR